MSKQTHPLFVWAKDNGLKLGWLARQAGVSHGALTSYIHGRMPAPLKVRRAFETVTGGDVTAEQWPEVK